jgi:response regulator RpfG family c-di-GMP phosphodiesterase
METKPQLKISRTLLLADNKDVITSFRSALTASAELLVASTTAQALNYLESSIVEVIISCPKFSNSTGIHFFEQIMSDHPDPVRILITEKNDLDTVIDAINKGRIYKYILKPWDESQLGELVCEASKLYSLRTDLEKRVSNYNEQLLQVELNLESLIDDIDTSNELSTNSKFDLITRLKSTIILLGIPD